MVISRISNLIWFWCLAGDLASAVIKLNGVALEGLLGLIPEYSLASRTSFIYKDGMLRGLFDKGLEIKVDVTPDDESDLAKAERLSPKFNKLTRTFQLQSSDNKRIFTLEPVCTSPHIEIDPKYIESFSHHPAVLNSKKSRMLGKYISEFQEFKFSISPSSLTGKMLKLARIKKPHLFLPAKSINPHFRTCRSFYLEVNLGKREGTNRKVINMKLLSDKTSTVGAEFLTSIRRGKYIFERQHST